jgi:hypothetical protein
MNGRATTQQVEGTVEATNAKGLKIAGAWVNVSQFNPLELPEAGAHVRLEVDFARLHQIARGPRRLQRHT